MEACRTSLLDRRSDEVGKCIRFTTAILPNRLDTSSLLDLERLGLIGPARYAIIQILAQLKRECVLLSDLTKFPVRSFPVRRCSSERPVSGAFGPSGKINRNSLSIRQALSLFVSLGPRRTTTVLTGPNIAQSPFLARTSLHGRAKIFT
jgi:hypothetical protein